MEEWRIADTKNVLSLFDDLIILMSNSNNEHSFHSFSKNIAMISNLTYICIFQTPKIGNSRCDCVMTLYVKKYVLKEAMIEFYDNDHSNDEDNEFQYRCRYYWNLSTSNPLQPLQNVRPCHLINYKLSTVLTLVNTTLDKKRFSEEITCIQRVRNIYATSILMRIWKLNMKVLMKIMITEMWTLIIQLRIRGLRMESIWNETCNYMLCKTSTDNPL